MNPHPNFKDKGALSILSWMLVGLFHSVLYVGLFNSESLNAMTRKLKKHMANLVQDESNSTA